MSAIIGICASNFCVFIGDMRRTKNDADSYVISDDSTHKVFKINNRLLFGATGLFLIEEDLTSALDSIEDLENATVMDALNAVLEYLEIHKHKIPKMRNYLIGGKTETGRFIVYEIHMNFETNQPEIISRMPESKEFGVSCSLPSKAMPMKNEYLSMVNNIIRTSGTFEELVQKVVGVIGEISKVDDTVGTNVEVVYIF